MNRMMKHVVEESRKTMEKALEKIQGFAAENEAMYHRAQYLSLGLQSELHYRGKYEAYDHAARILQEQIKRLDDLLPWEDLPF